MIGSVFIAALLHNDNWMLYMRGLNSYLVSLLCELVLINGQSPALYGDGVFQILSIIVPLFRLHRALTPDELAFFLFLNWRYSSLRQCIEHVFGQHRNICGIFDSRTHFLLFMQRDHVVKCLILFLIPIIVFVGTGLPSSLESQLQKFGSTFLLMRTSPHPLLY